jgi:hypothetical protein
MRTLEEEEEEQEEQEEQDGLSKTHEAIAN